MPHYRDPQPAAKDENAAENNPGTATSPGQLQDLAGDHAKSGEPSATEVHSEALRLDVVLALLVIILAVFLAAFPVRNSDFWMHLATGRRILSGEANFGVDPYSYTTSGVYWANTAWCYDVFFYGLTRLAGGEDQPLAGYLVIGAKALMVAVLALIILLTRRRSESLWVPVVCTAIALLTMSPRLVLQPILVSALFLALTVFILQRPRNERR